MRIDEAVDSLRRVGGIYGYVAAAVENAICPTCGHEAIWHRDVVGCVLEGCECSAVASAER